MSTWTTFEKQTQLFHTIVQFLTQQPYLSNLNDFFLDVTTNPKEPDELLQI